MRLEVIIAIILWCVMLEGMLDNVYHFFFFGCWFPGHNVQFVKIYKVVHSGTVSKLYFNKIFY